MHDDLSTIVETNSLSAGNNFAPSFWEQQKKAASVKKSGSMKWHPLLIK